MKCKNGEGTGSFWVCFRKLLFLPKSPSSSCTSLVFPLLALPIWYFVFSQWLFHGIPLTIQAVFFTAPCVISWTFKGLLKNLFFFIFKNLLNLLLDNFEHLCYACWLLSSPHPYLWSLVYLNISHNYIYLSCFVTFWDKQGLSVWPCFWNYSLELVYSAVGTQLKTVSIHPLSESIKSH